MAALTLQTARLIIDAATIAARCVNVIACLDEQRHEEAAGDGCGPRARGAAARQRPNSA